MAFANTLSHSVSTGKLSAPFSVVLINGKVYFCFIRLIYANCCDACREEHKEAHTNRKVRKVNV